MRAGVSGMAASFSSNQGVVSGWWELLSCAGVGVAVFFFVLFFCFFVFLFFCFSGFCFVLSFECWPVVLIACRFLL